MRNYQQNRSKHLLRYAIYTLSFLVLLLLIYFLYSLFRIKSVVVVNTSNIQASDISTIKTEYGKGIVGKEIFLFSNSSVEYKNLILIQFVKEYPNTIKIYVSILPGYIAIQTTKDTTLVTVSGGILGTTSNNSKSNANYIYVVSDVNIDSINIDNLITMVSAIEKIPHFTPYEFHLEKDKLVVTFFNHTSAVFSLTENISTQVSKMEETYKYITISKCSIIDLRFLNVYCKAS